MPKSAADVTKKWASRTTAAVPEWVAGIDGVTTAPGQQAAAKADAWQAKLAMAETREKFQSNVAAVSLAAWKERTKSKGQGRISAGVQAATAGMQDFFTQFLPHVYNVAQSVRTMPKLTVEDGIARAAAQIRGNAAFRYTRRG